jgi:hypothetical protein
MKKKIKFPAGAEDIVKNAMFINMRRLFRKWKFELNTNYVKKGLMPKYMGKIIEVQWKEFIQHKTAPKALAISNKYAEMSKKNIYPHHMRSKGYVAKIPEWKRKIEEVVSVGNPNPVEDIEKRIVNWLLARSELTQDGKFIHKKKGVVAVQEKTVQLTEKKRLDLFKSDSENNVLSGALNKNDTLAKFPQLCNYERFVLWNVISIDILENNVNIDDRCCEYYIFDWYCEYCCE